MSKLYQFLFVIFVFCSTHAMHAADATLPVDSAYHHGTFPNGLRYFIRENATPKGRCELRLLIETGSLDEQDHEQGMAHFLEHLAFDGSRYFPKSNQVQDEFQRLGVKSGAHINAATSTHDTVYQLDLPSCEASAIDTSFKFFSDILDGLSILDEQVAREKPVIDAEELSRKSPQYKIAVALQEKLYAGTKLPHRLPIGIKSVRDMYNKQAIEAFWRETYHPRRAVLVVVGDIEREPIMHAASHYLGSIVNDVPVRAREERPSRIRFNLIDTVHHPDFLGTQISFLMRKFDLNPRSAEGLKFFLSIASLRIGMWLRDQMENSHLNPDNIQQTTLIDRGIEPAIGFNLFVSSHEKFPQFESAFKKRLAEFLTEISSLSDRDFEQIKQTYRESYEQQKKAEPSRKHGSYVSDVLAYVREQSPLLSFDESFQLWEEFVGSKNAAEFINYLSNALRNAPVQVIAAGNIPPQFSADYLKDLVKGVEPSASVSSIAPCELCYIYDDNKEPVDCTYDPNTDTTSLRYENGFTAIIKKTDLEKNRVFAFLASKGGTRSLSRDEVVTSRSLDYLYGNVSLRKLSFDQLRTLFPLGPSLNFAVHASELMYTGAGTVDKLEQMLTLLRGAIEDAVSATTVAAQQRRFKSTRATMKTKPHWPLVNSFSPLVWAGDVHKVLTTDRQNELLTETETRRVYEKLRNGPRTLFLVGDIDVEKAQTLITKIFSGLEPVSDTAPGEAAAKMHEMTTGLNEHYVHCNEDRKCVLDLCIKLKGSHELRDQIKRTLFVTLLKNKLYETLRIGDGSIYGITAEANNSPYYSPICELSLEATEEEFTHIPQRFHETLASIPANGFSEDDFLKAVNPLLDAYSEYKHNISAWPNAWQRTLDLDGLTTMLASQNTLKSISCDEINEYAREVLQRDNYSQAIVMPQSN